MELLEQPLAAQKKNDFKSVLHSYLRRWPWFVLSLLFFTVLAWLYLRYTTPQYLSRSSVYIVSAKKQASATAGMPDLSAAMSGGFSQNDIENEIALMKARPLLEQVVKNVQADSKVVNAGRIKETQLYSERPFDVQIRVLPGKRKFSGKSYRIAPAGVSAFRLLPLEGGPAKTFSYGVPVKEDFGSFTLVRRPVTTFKGELLLHLYNPANIAAQLEGRIGIEVAEKKTSILNLSLTGPLPEKSEDILNELVRQYNREAIADKNAEAQNTAAFIDERLDLITRELGNIEGQKEIFKKNNNITDLQSQAQLSLETANENTRKMMEVGAQLELVNSVLSQAEGSSERLLPSNMGMPSGVDALIAEYNELLLTRNKTLRQATGANPAVQSISREISSMKGLIRDNLRTTRSSLQRQLGDIQSKISASRAEINRFPTQERVFRNIDRQQNIKEALYLYLLQKREETSITLAVTSPKAKVVNPAYTQAAPVLPNRQQIYGGAALLGLLIPFMFFYVRNMLDTFIHSKRDISNALPDAVILGEIPRLLPSESDVVEKNDFTSFAESFRILMTNLKFFVTAKVPQGSTPVILVTSSVKGEGKTTVSVNTAITLAQTRRVLLIGADIRNPQLKRYLPEPHQGLTDFLVAPDFRPEEHLTKAPDVPNLHILHSGGLAPNPTELLDLPRFGELVDYFKGKYDYIVIDSAPMLMVSDTHNLIKHADAVMYVLRADYTEKEVTEFIAQLGADKAKNKLALVLNGVDSLHLSYGNKYGYGYGQQKHTRTWKDYFKL